MSLHPPTVARTLLIRPRPPLAVACTPPTQPGTASGGRIRVDTSLTHQPQTTMSHDRSRQLLHPSPWPVAAAVGGEGVARRRPVLSMLSPETHGHGRDEQAREHCHRTRE